MTTFEEIQKKRNMEAFEDTVALYTVLKSNSAALRAKQVSYHAEEMEILPIDFVIDVEVKVRRAVGQRFYDIFLRSVYNENTEILSETLREALGKTFLEYSLTPDGPYRRLYYKIKNDQTRSYMKGTVNGVFSRNDD
jgi:hypothetical protein